MVDIWYQILILSTVYDVTLNPFLNYKQRQHTKVPLIMVHVSIKREMTHKYHNSDQYTTSNIQWFKKSLKIPKG
jgi:hypothetical protein